MDIERIRILAPINLLFAMCHAYFHSCSIQSYEYTNTSVLPLYEFYMVTMTLQYRYAPESGIRYYFQKPIAADLSGQNCNNRTRSTSLTVMT